MIMRILHGKLFKDKETDEKLRWTKDVDGVPFKLYITQDRIPRPFPNAIEVSMFADKSLYTMILTTLGRKRLKQLTDGDRSYLRGIGLGDAQTAVAGEEAILGAAFISPDCDHTETVRYNAGRKVHELEFGDPYIPRSILPKPYPERLLFLVRWLN
jgi:hypothetical protein